LPNDRLSHCLRLPFPSANRRTTACSTFQRYPVERGLNWWLCWEWDRRAWEWKDRGGGRVSYANTYALMPKFPRSRPRTSVYPSEVEMLQTCHTRSLIRGRRAALGSQSRTEAQQAQSAWWRARCLWLNFESCG
jgi:hypothetical protein